MSFRRTKKALRALLAALLAAPLALACSGAQPLAFGPLVQPCGEAILRSSEAALALSKCRDVAECARAVGEHVNAAVEVQECVEAVQHLPQPPAGGSGAGGGPSDAGAVGLQRRAGGTWCPEGEPRCALA